MAFTGKQKTAATLFGGYLLAMLLDPFVTVMRLNVENWATENGYSAIYSWPVLSQLWLVLVSVWEAFTGSWGFGFICGSLLLAFWEPLRRVAGSMFRRKRSAATSLPSKNRIPVGPSITPEFLVSLYKGKTSLEAKEAVRPYLGKWMKFTGIMKDITSFSSSANYGVFFKVPRTDGNMWQIHLWAYFAKGDEQLPLIRPGDAVSLEGEIEMIEESCLRLMECKLISVEATTLQA